MNKKIAIYVRVSTLEQAESGYSISEQINKLEKYCDLHDYTVYNVYEDGGFSGSNIDRPAISKLIKHAKEKRFDCVLVYKLDRLSRSQKDTLYLIEDILLKNDIDFLSMQENFDTSSAFGKAMIGILSVFAQLEREQIKERFQLGKLGRARSGKPMNWASPAFGYQIVNDELVINPIQAEIVKQIYQEYLAGKSKTKIVSDLNRAGHIGKEVNWSNATLTSVLTSKTYIGLVSYRGQSFEGNHEALVSPEDYEKVQELIENHRRVSVSRNFEGKYILSGLLYCGVCGKTMRIYANSNQIKSGTARYKCNYQKRKYTVKNPKNVERNCDSESYYQSDLEEYVLSEIAKLQADNSLIEKIMGTNKSSFDESAIKKEIKGYEKKIDKLNNLYLNDLISLEDLKNQTATLKNQKAKLLDKIEKHQQEPKPIDISKLPNILELDTPQQKILINQLISRIDVDEKGIAIHWAF